MKREEAKAAGTSVSEAAATAFSDDVPAHEAAAISDCAASSGFAAPPTPDNGGYVSREGGVFESLAEATYFQSAASDTFFESPEEHADDPEVIVAVKRLRHRVVYRCMKRIFDIVFSLFVLICFCWLFALIAAAIKIDDPKGSIIFRQTRVGKEQRHFTMYKFRSMCIDAEDKLAELKARNEKAGPVFKMHDDPRVTRVGRILRKMSLDELPQFLNVLKGDMSTVGPRPALTSEVIAYNNYQRQRLLMKPGLTCYWQTRRNRDSITFDEWIDLDLLYIKNCGIRADAKLIIQTVGCVLTAQGS